MLEFVDTTVYIDGFLVCGERFVEICFFDIGAEAVDCFQRGGRVKREGIGTSADYGAVVGVQTVVAEVAGAAVGVVGEVDVGDGGEAGAGVFGEGVER